MIRKRWNVCWAMAGSDDGQPAHTCHDAHIHVQWEGSSPAWRKWTEGCNKNLIQLLQAI
jgi:hypothetical protein